MKPEYSEQTADLDLLILGASFADGKMRSGLLSRFLLGVAVPNADGSSPPTKFWPITRVRRGGLHEWVGLGGASVGVGVLGVGGDVACRCCRTAQWVAVAVVVVVVVVRGDLVHVVVCDWCSNGAANRFESGATTAPDFSETLQL